MSTLSLRLPDSVHMKVKELAERDAVSINQFIATAVAEKMAAMLSVEYLAERAGRGDRAVFERALSRVQSRAPLEGDELPVALTRPARHPAKAARKRRRKGSRGQE